jgi:hypothetical protein
MLDFLKILIILSLFFLPMTSFGAETVKLRHLQSIYLDEKDRSLNLPEGVACNDKSLLIVGDTGNDRLLQYTFQGKNLKGGTEIKVPQLSNPTWVQINSKGEILALDRKKRRIIRLNPDGSFKGYVNPEEVPSPSAFVPKSFKIDLNDHVYILDIFSGRVLVLDSQDKYQKQIPFPQGDGFYTDLAVDFRGNIFLIDSTRLMLFSAPKEGNSFIPLGGNLKEYLNFPAALTTDSKGILYVVDQDSGGIVIFGQDGSFLGRQLSMGWNEGLLRYPSQMCINAQGEGFIADRQNSRVQIFTLAK